MGGRIFVHACTKGISKSYWYDFPCFILAYGIIVHDVQKKTGSRLVARRSGRLRGPKTANRR